MAVAPVALTFLIFAVLLAACGGPSAGASGRSLPAKVRLGFFPNLTHATALVGAELGYFGRELPPGVDLEVYSFNAGPAAIESLFSGGLDLTYIGPNPALNGYVRSRGEAVRVVSGATSGGAALVVRPGITTADDLRGKKLATPQLGNTQDVALRKWLAAQGLKTTTTGAGDANLISQDNAQTLELFRTRQIDGAWVPEPWATRLVLEGGGHVLVDERSLWPGGQFATTLLIARTEFLRDHPDLVEAILRGHAETTVLLNKDPDESRRVATRALARLTGSAMPEGVVAAGWRNLTFTNDPIAGSVRRAASDLADLGFLELRGVSPDGIFDLGPLNRALKARGETEVSTS